jgi:hypothetical protein
MGQGLVETGRGPGGRGQGPGRTGQGPGGTGKGPGGVVQEPGATGQEPGGTGQGPGGAVREPGGTGQGPGGRDPAAPVVGGTKSTSVPAEVGCGEKALQPSGCRWKGRVYCSGEVVEVRARVVARVVAMMNDATRTSLCGSSRLCVWRGR